MALKFSQEYIEKEIARVFVHGDITDISNISGIGYSYIDQMLNPNDTRKSYLVGALQILCALDEKDSDRGDELFRLFSKFREMSKDPAEDGDCIQAGTRKLNREVADVVNAHIAGHDLDVQLKEVLEAEEAVRDLRRSLTKLCAGDRLAKIESERRAA